MPNLPRVVVSADPAISQSADLLDPIAGVRQRRGGNQFWAADLTSALAWAMRAPAWVLLDAGVHPGPVTFAVSGVTPPGGSVRQVRPATWPSTPHLYQWDQPYYDLASLEGMCSAESPAVIDGDLIVTGSFVRIQHLHIRGDLHLTASCAGAVVCDCRIDGSLIITGPAAHAVVRCLFLGPQGVSIHGIHDGILVESCVARVAPVVTTSPCAALWSLEGDELPTPVTAAASVRRSANPGAIRPTSPATLVADLARSQPGDVLTLSPGTYGDALLRSPGHPVTIQGHPSALVRGTWGIIGPDVTLSQVEFRYRNLHALVIGSQAARTILDDCRLVRDDGKPVPTLVLQNPLYILGPQAPDVVVRRCLLDGSCTDLNAITRHVFDGGSNSIGMQLCEGRGNLNLVVDDCTIRGFMYGIQLGHGTTRELLAFATVSACTITGCGDGLHNKSDGNRISGNCIRGNAKHGITLRFGIDALVSDNDIQDNTVGIRIHGSHHRLERNQIRGCTGPGVLVQGGIGFDRMGYTPSRGIRLEQNLLDGCRLICCPGSEVLARDNIWSQPPIWLNRVGDDTHGLALSEDTLLPMPHLMRGNRIAHPGDDARGAA